MSQTDCDRKAVSFLVRESQKQDFAETYFVLQSKKCLGENNKLAGLTPFLDESGVIRVGGRLSNSDFPFIEKHPILLPPKNRLTISVLQHYHEKSSHQGRHLTAGMLREGGYHIHNQRSTISKFLASCVTCNKSRGQFCSQQMANLPSDRIEKSPPFTNTGIDVFGPYFIHDGKNTRRNSAQKKVWVLLCT